MEGCFVERLVSFMISLTRCKSESQFYSIIKEYLARLGEVYRIESHSSCGIPDVFLMTYHTALWIELKWNGSLSGGKEVLSHKDVGWRPGQRAFAIRSFKYGSLPVITLIGCPSGIYVLQCKSLQATYEASFISEGAIGLLTSKLHTFIGGK